MATNNNDCNDPSLHYETVYSQSFNQMTKFEAEIVHNDINYSIFNRIVTLKYIFSWFNDNALLSSKIIVSLVNCQLLLTTQISKCI